MYPTRASDGRRADPPGWDRAGARPAGPGASRAQPAVYNSGTASAQFFKARAERVRAYLQQSGLDTGPRSPRRPPPDAYHPPEEPPQLGAGLDSDSALDSELDLLGSDTETAALAPRSPRSPRLPHAAKDAERLEPITPAPTPRKPPPRARSEHENREARPRAKPGKGTQTLPAEARLPAASSAQQQPPPAARASTRASARAPTHGARTSARDASHTPGARLPIHNAAPDDLSPEVGRAHSPEVHEALAAAEAIRLEARRLADERARLLESRQKLTEERDRLKREREAELARRQRLEETRELQRQRAILEQAIAELQPGNEELEREVELERIQVARLRAEHTRMLDEPVRPQPDRQPHLQPNLQPNLQPDLQPDLPRLQPDFPSLRPDRPDQSNLRADNADPLEAPTPLRRKRAAAAQSSPKRARTGAADRHDGAETRPDATRAPAPRPGDPLEPLQFSAPNTTVPLDPYTLPGGSMDDQTLRLIDRMLQFGEAKRPEPTDPTPADAPAVPRPAEPELSTAPPPRRRTAPAREHRVYEMWSGSQWRGFSEALQAAFEESSVAPASALQLLDSLRDALPREMQKMPFSELAARVKVWIRLSKKLGQQP